MAAKRNSTAIPAEGKHIRYDRETKDYACYLNGEFIGYAPNYSDGETLCENTYYAQLSHASAPATEPAPEAVSLEVEPITVETWQNEDGVVYSDLVAGEGLTKVLIGARAPHEPGIELIIGGRPINERLEEVLTLTDLARLRDNLTALLNDTRLLVAMEATPPPTPAAPAFPIPTVPAQTKSGSWQTQIGLIDGMPVVGHYAGRELMHVQLHYQGMRVAVYGEYLNFQVGADLSFGGDCYMHEWRTLAALGRTDIVDRLLALYERYQTAQGGTECEGCGKTLTPKDEDQLCGACREQRWQARYGHLRGAQVFRASFQQVA